MKASGGFPERFLNLCSHGNIPYWDAGMRMKIVKKSGLPFLLSKNRVHAGLAVGAVFFILITAALSGRIWTVNVTGCETVPEEDIRETV